MIGNIVRVLLKMSVANNGLRNDILKQFYILHIIIEFIKMFDVLYDWNNVIIPANTINIEFEQVYVFVLLNREYILQCIYYNYLS